MINTDLPFYTYGTHEVPAVGDGALFHYTKSDSFFSIIESLTFKPSSFKNLNDLNEANVYNLNMGKNFMVMCKASRYIKEKCSLISFSQNYEYKGYVQEGTNHPGMWAHYANDSDGVCIVFDKEKFIKRNKDIFENHFFCFDNVEYSYFNTPEDEEVFTDTDNPVEFVEKNCHNLFFLKHFDWEHEGEHRLFISGYTDMFSIKDCIKYIVLGQKFWKNDEHIKKLVDMITNPQSACYKQFKPHSFAMINYHQAGYLTYPAEHLIFECLRRHCKENVLYSEYIDWLNNEQGYL